jgi:DNA-binding protein H-NS
LAKPPSLPLDLKAHSDELLWLIIAGAQSELQERKTKREADFIEQVKEGARQLSIPYERLAARLGVKSARPTALRPASALPEEGREGNRADGRSVVKPKYRNPADPSQTWSGRGAAPQWVADRLAAGGKKEDLAIPRDEE